MEAATFNFPEIYQGDTFNQRKLVITTNGLPTDLTNAVVKLVLMIDNKKTVVFTMPTTITDELNGVITLNSWDVALPPHKYQYELIITKDNGYTLTYMVGQFPVLR